MREIRPAIWNKVPKISVCKQLIIHHVLITPYGERTYRITLEQMIILSGQHYVIKHGLMEKLGFHN